MAFSDIYSTSYEYREKKPADAVTDNIALLYYMKSKGRQKVIGGGRFISENIRLVNNAFVQLLNADDEVAMGQNNMLADFQYSPKIMVAPILINYLEEAQNSGAEQFLDLFVEREEVTESSLANTLEAMLQGDGTTYGGKAFSGIRTFIADSPSSGSVGGLSRSTYSAIRNTAVNAPSTFTGATTASNIESRVRYVKNTLVRGKDRPDVFLAGQTYFNAGADAMSAKQRFVENKAMTEANFDNYVIENMTVLLAQGKINSGLAHIAADRGYLLNSNTFSLKLYKGFDMQPFKKESWNQLAKGAILLTIGNFTCNNPGLNGVMFDS